MHEHRQLRRRLAEEPPRLDQLQGLVHHRGGVDRDLPAHRPGGVLERLLRRDMHERVARPRAKRPAAGGEHDPRHLVGRAGAKGLVDGRMLAVDRHDPAAGPFGQPHRQRPRHHERLFVGKGHGLPGLERRPRAPQPRCAHDRRHDTVDLRRLDEIIEGVRADRQPRAFRERPGANLGRRGGIDDDHPSGTAGLCLLHEQPRAAMRGEQKGGKPLG